MIKPLLGFIPWVAAISFLVDKDAATLLSEMVRNAENSLIIDTFKPDYWVKKWSKYGIPGVTLKDLRRASLYWLGHYSNLTFNGLRNHARHTNYDTTLLYTRRPEEDFVA